MLLLGRRRFPKLLWFMDAKIDQIEVKPGNRIILTYRYSRPSIVQNLALKTFWPIHRGSMGCFSVIACLMAVAGIFACTVILTMR